METITFTSDAVVHTALKNRVYAYCSVRKLGDIYVDNGTILYMEKLPEFIPKIKSDNRIHIGTFSRSYVYKIEK